MVRVVALWGQSWAREEKKDWKRKFKRLQSQVLCKCIGAVFGANRPKLNAITVVEDVDTILQATQSRHIARCMADPSTTADIWEQAYTDKGGYLWDMTDHSRDPSKGQKRKDGY